MVQKPRWKISIKTWWKNRYSVIIYKQIIFNKIEQGFNLYTEWSCHWEACKVIYSWNVEYVMTCMSQSPMKMLERWSLYLNGQWEIGEVYQGRDLMTTQLRRWSLTWQLVLVSSAFCNWSYFGENLVVTGCYWSSWVPCDTLSCWECNDMFFVLSLCRRNREMTSWIKRVRHMFSLILNVTVCCCVLWHLSFGSARLKQSESLVVMFCRILEEV